MIKRLKWWIRCLIKKECRHCCLWCQYFKDCSNDWASTTKDEAIEVLQSIVDEIVNDGDEVYLKNKDKEALQMAIKALKEKK